MPFEKCQRLFKHLVEAHHRLLGFSVITADAKAAVYRTTHRVGFHT